MLLFQNIDSIRTKIWYFVSNSNFSNSDFPTCINELPNLQKCLGNYYSWVLIIIVVVWSNVGYHSGSLHRLRWLWNHCGGNITCGAIITRSMFSKHRSPAWWASGFPGNLQQCTPWSVVMLICIIYHYVSLLEINLLLLLLQNNSSQKTRDISPVRASSEVFFGFNFWFIFCFSHCSVACNIMLYWTAL